MRAIMTCVGYDDLLSITLPYNRHHFEQVWVVTHPDDLATIDVVSRNGVCMFLTNAFYRNGACFAKWLALELALDEMGREGWLCVMDADVMWPKGARLRPVKGTLTSPLRRMHEGRLPIPDELTWGAYPLHRNIGEWAGYSQVFHASDPVLGPPPWHEVDWKHAGGADSFFQRKWSPENKVRPDWECLHIGPTGTNWCGRASPRLDGREVVGAKDNAAAQRHLLDERRRTRSFDGEKLA